VTRVGLGFDVHPRGSSTPLWLGGLRFDDELGLRGHSDGDVVAHAIADALLGAAALGDLGEHFPDTDPAIEGISGRDLLGRTREILLSSGWAPVACDAVVIAERPAIAARRIEMREQLAGVLGIDVGDVSVKATRPEGMGLTGEGAACLAIATVREA